MSDDEFIEWYRVDQSRQIRRTLGSGAAILTLGALIAAISFVTRQPEAIRYVAVAVGIACVIAGALTTVVGMYRGLRDDAYVAVTKTGIVLKLASEPVLARWEDLERVRFDEASNSIVFTWKDAVDVVAERPFAGIASAELASRLDGMRRKAAWNLL